MSLLNLMKKHSEVIMLFTRDDNIIKLTEKYQ